MENNSRFKRGLAALVASAAIFSNSFAATPSEPNPPTKKPANQVKNISLRYGNSYFRSGTYALPAPPIKPIPPRQLPQPQPRQPNTPILIPILSYYTIGSLFGVQATATYNLCYVILTVQAMQTMRHAGR
jgi:hypothetical protein